MKLIIHTDGGARGNPGPAAVGVVATDEKGKVIFEFGRYIDETTNNVAEYTAVTDALSWIKDHEAQWGSGGKIFMDFYLDSMLVVNQLNGTFRVKDSKLRELLSRIRILEQQVGGEVKYSSVPREQNKRADFLVNQALDKIVR